MKYLFWIYVLLAIWLLGKAFPTKPTSAFTRDMNTIRNSTKLSTPQKRVRVRQIMSNRTNPQSEYFMGTK